MLSSGTGLPDGDLLAIDLGLLFLFGLVPFREPKDAPVFFPFFFRSPAPGLADFDRALLFIGD